jgi:aspartyl/asparaginyl-tRNA synthetase
MIMSLEMNPGDYGNVARRLRNFFHLLGYTEVDTQSNLAVVKACEDPFTVSPFTFGGTTYPLPQSAQMTLEDILLTNTQLQGVYTFSTSYRDEPNPVEGRHQKVFPMFEFEGRGDIKELLKVERELLKSLGFVAGMGFSTNTYEDLCKERGKTILDHDDEGWLCKEYTSCAFITKFPDRTSPYWNMKDNGDGTAEKVDVIIHGQETIGSAERSCNPDEMWHNFLTIMEGEYAKKLYELFGEKRVDEEVQEYLKHDFTPRFGAGIGLSRLVRGLKLEGIL